MPLGPVGFIAKLCRGGSGYCDRCSSSFSRVTAIREDDLHWLYEHPLGRAQHYCIRCTAAIWAEKVAEDHLSPFKMLAPRDEVRGLDARNTLDWLLFTENLLSQDLQEQMNDIRHRLMIELFVLYCHTAGLEVTEDEFDAYSFEAECWGS